MCRYFIYLSYNGTAYCGWQRQPNGISIQQMVEEALATMTQRTVPIVGAGRTDAGVHARTMPAHFDCEQPIEDLELLAHKLNKLLPKDIAVNKILPVQPTAHARFDACERVYQYAVTGVKNPFNYERVCFMSLKDIDFALMNEAAATLLEYSDFTSFSKLHTDVKTNNCHITKALWSEKADSEWVFTIVADRFLRNMVRAIVGTLFEVGRGRRSVNDFRQLIEAKDRRLAGTSADACGLTLCDVVYGNEIFMR